MKKKYPLLLPTLLLSILIVAQTDPNKIDFEPGNGFNPTDQMPVDNNFFSGAYGVTFHLNSPSGPPPVMAKVGGDITAFQGPNPTTPLYDGCPEVDGNTFNDMPAFGEDAGCWFLTDDIAVNQNPEPLFITYSSDCSVAAGILYDIDASERWTIEAFKPNTIAPVQTIHICADGNGSFGPCDNVNVNTGAYENVGDGIGTPWEIDLGSDVISYLKFSYTGNPNSNVGLAFDCFTFCSTTGCNDWEDLYFGFPGLNSFEVPATTNNTDTIVLSCPNLSNSFYLHGNFICSSDEELMGMKWEVNSRVLTSIPVASGIITGYNDGSNTRFHFDIANIDYPQAGLYSLDLKAQCGSDTCESSILFEKPDCTPDCNCEQLIPDANAIISAIHISDCNTSLFPTFDLDADCDQVNWTYFDGTTINGIPIGTSQGSDPINYTFPFSPNANTYQICMEVIRTLPDSTICPPEERCQKVKIKCAPPTVPCDATEPLIADPGFLSKLDSSGTIDYQWQISYGLPEVIDGLGCPDSFLIKLSGNKLEADAISTLIDLNGKQTYSLSTCIRGEAGLVHPGTRLVIRISDEPQLSMVCEGNCQEIEITAAQDAIVDWVFLELNTQTYFDLDPALNEGTKYLTIHLENNSEDAGLKSLAYLDAVCLEAFDVGSPTSNNEVFSASELPLFPNPTNSKLTLDLEEPIGSKVHIEIIDIMGRIWEKTKFPKGISKYSLDVNDLPNAVYFIKLTDEIGRTWHGKFIKQ